MHKYEKIRLELTRRINSQAWPVGASIPHEDELAEEFGVARGTIRQALSSLVDAGYLEKKRRAGTRVAYPKDHASTLRIALVREQVEQGGHTYGYRLLKDSIEDGIRRVLCLHLRDDAPYQLEDREISLTGIPSAVAADFSQISPNEWLLQQQPYSRVQTVLKASAPNRNDRKHLELPRDEPVFLVLRETYLEEVWLTRVRLSHPASSYSVRMERAFD